MKEIKIAEEIDQKVQTSTVIQINVNKFYTSIGQFKYYHPTVSFESNLLNSLK